MVASQRIQNFGLVGRLNAFCRHCHSKIVAEHDDRIEDVTSFLIMVVQRCDEGAVDFQFVETELPEIAEA